MQLPRAFVASEAEAACAQTPQGRDHSRLGLAWLGLAWLGLAWLGLAWLGLAWLGPETYTIAHHGWCRLPSAAAKDGGLNEPAILWQQPGSTTSRRQKFPLHAAQIPSYSGKDGRKPRGLGIPRRGLGGRRGEAAANKRTNDRKEEQATRAEEGTTK